MNFALEQLLAERCSCLIQVTYQWIHHKNGMKTFSHTKGLSSEKDKRPDKELTTEHADKTEIIGCKTFERYSQAIIWITQQKGKQIFHSKTEAI